MRRIIAIFVAVYLFLTLSACSRPAGRRDFAYAEGAFTVSLSGTYCPASDSDGTPRPFAATVTAGEPTGGDPTLRDLTLIFTAPDALRGSTVTAVLSSGPDTGNTARRQVTFTYPSDYGEVRTVAKGSEFDGLLRFAEALLPLGDVTYVSPVTEDGTRTVTRERGSRTVTFRFSEDSIYPTALRLTDARGTVDCTVRPLP